MFEQKLIPDILSYLPVREIGRICSSAPSRAWRRLCRDENLWRHLLYRDYGTFAPIIRELGPISYLDLYRQFYRDRFLNSRDIRELYAILSQNGQAVKFLDWQEKTSLFPSLIQLGLDEIRLLKVAYNNDVRRGSRTGDQLDLFSDTVIEMDMDIPLMQANEIGKLPFYVRFPSYFYPSKLQIQAKFVGNTIVLERKP